MSALGRRYAKAALQASAESAGGDAQLSANRADALAADVKGFVSLVQQSSMLQQLLAHPGLKPMRGQVLQEILLRLKLGPVAHKLIALLASNDRMAFLGAISAQIEFLADQQIGRLRAHIHAVVLPSAAQTQRLAQTLQRRLGRPVWVTVSEAPELLAGLVCQVGDLTFDSSLKRQLAILTERLGTHGASS